MGSKQLQLTGSSGQLYPVGHIVRVTLSSVRTALLVLWRGRRTHWRWAVSWAAANAEGCLVPLCTLLASASTHLSFSCNALPLHPLVMRAIPPRLLRAPAGPTHDNLHAQSTFLDPCACTVYPLAALSPPTHSLAKYSPSLPRGPRSRPCPARAAPRASGAPAIEVRPDLHFGGRWMVARV